MATTIPTLSPTPVRGDPDTFSTAFETFLTGLDPWAVAVQAVGTEVAALAVAMGSLASGAATAIPYTFSTTTTDADPGAGILRLDNATQNAATTIRADLVGSDGSTWTSLLDTFDDSTSTIKGFIMLQKASDATKWLLFSVSALASPSGYKNITVSNVASSVASPFADADALLLKFQRNGDKGDTGVTGAAGADGADGADGLGVPAQVTTATTATTLTSTATLLKITPASYGVAVTLPDATTCSVGGPLHIIDNRGAYPVRVLNSAGTLLGFIFAGVVSHVSLIDNSSAAGTWTVENSELVGASAQLLTTSIRVIYSVIDIGSNQEVIIGGINGTSVSAVVYNRATNTFGNVTLVRNTTFGGANFPAVLSGTNQILFCSCDSTTGFEAVTLSISGTTITVNTAATATLSATIYAFADGCGLIAVGSSFVTSYTVVTPAAQIRALSISGTTVTIGSASALGTSATGGGLITSESDKLIALSWDATTSAWVDVFTVSGTTLTLGTKGATGNVSGAVTAGKLHATGTAGRFFYLTQAGGSRAGFATLSGTTITCSDVNYGAWVDAIKVTPTTYLILTSATSSNANILTDTAGAASAGTAITLSSGDARYCGYVSGTDAMVWDTASGGAAYVMRVDCSGSSPVLSTKQQMWLSAAYGSFISASNAVLSRTANCVFGTNFADSTTVMTNLTTASRALRAFDASVVAKSYSPNLPNCGSTKYRGKSDSERWVSDTSTVITKLECVA